MWSSPYGCLPFCLFGLCCTAGVLEFQNFLRILLPDYLLFLLQALQAAAPSLPFLVLTGLESRGTSCISFSPKGSPLESSKWLNEALKELGGKGGGKERSVGAAKDGTVNGLKRAITAAVAFAEAALQ